MEPMAVPSQVAAPKRLRTFKLFDSATGDKYSADVPEEQVPTFLEAAKGKKMEAKEFLPVRVTDKQSGQTYKAQLAPGFYDEWKKGVEGEGKFAVSVPETHVPPLTKPRLPENIAGAMPSVLGEEVTQAGQFWWERVKTKTKAVDAFISKKIAPVSTHAPKSATKVAERLREKLTQEAEPLYPAPVGAGLVNELKLKPKLEKEYGSKVNMAQEPTEAVVGESPAVLSEKYREPGVFKDIVVPMAKNYAAPVVNATENVNEILLNTLFPVNRMLDLKPLKIAPLLQQGPAATDLDPAVQKTVNLGVKGAGALGSLVPYTVAQTMLGPVFRSAPYLAHIKKLAAKNETLAKLADVGIRNAAVFNAVGQATLPAEATWKERLHKFEEESINSALFTGASAIGSIPAVGKSLLEPVALAGIGMTMGTTPEEKAFNAFFLVGLHGLGAGIGAAKRNIREAGQEMGFDRKTINNVEDFFVANAPNLRKNVEMKLDENYRRNMAPEYSKMQPEEARQKYNEQRASYGLEPKDPPGWVEPKPAEVAPPAVELPTKKPVEPAAPTRTVTAEVAKSESMQRLEQQLIKLQQQTESLRADAENSGSQKTLQEYGDTAVQAAALQDTINAARYSGESGGAQLERLLVEPVRGNAYADSDSIRLAEVILRNKTNPQHIRLAALQKIDDLMGLGTKVSIKELEAWDTQQAKRSDPQYWIDDITRSKQMSAELKDKSTLPTNSYATFATDADAGTVKPTVREVKAKYGIGTEKASDWIVQYKRAKAATVKPAQDLTEEEPTANELSPVQVDRGIELANVDFSKRMGDLPDNLTGWKLERIEGGLVRAVDPQGEVFYAKGTNLYKSKAPAGEGILPATPVATPVPPPVGSLTTLEDPSPLEEVTTNNAPLPSLATEDIGGPFEHPHLAPRAKEIVSGAPRILLGARSLGLTHEDLVAGPVGQWLGLDKLEPSERALVERELTDYLYKVEDSFESPTADRLEEADGETEELSHPGELPADYSFGDVNKDVPDPLYGAQVPKGKQPKLDMTDTKATSNRPTNATAVIKSLEKVLKTAGGVGNIRPGYLRRKKSLGEYNGKTDIIRLRRANNIPIAAHETFHGLLKALYGSPFVKKALTGITPKIRAELTAMGQALYGAVVPNGGYSSEGWAEFGRHWLTTDDAGAAVAPATHKWFSTEFKADFPEAYAELEKARELITTFRKQGAEARLKSHQVEPSAAKARIGRIVDAAITHFQRNWSDEAIALSKLARAYEAATGNALSIVNDPHKLKEALWLTHHGVVHGWYEQGMTDLAGNIIGPSLREIGKLASHNPQGFKDLLVARRAKNWIERGLDPGVEEADANFVIEQHADDAKLQLATEKYRAWTNGVLKYAKDAGLITEETYSRILERSLDFVPFYRVDETTNNDLLGKWVKSFSESTSSPTEQTPSSLKQATGSGRRIFDPMYSSVDMAINIVKQSHRRMVINAMLNLRHGEGMGAYIHEVPKGVVPHSLELGQIKKQLTDMGIDVNDADLNAQLTFFSPAKSPKGMEPIIPLYEKGELKWFYVHPELWDALNSNNPFRLPILLDLMFGVPKRVFNLAVTGLRPAFSLITNPSRDIVALLNQSQAKAGIVPMLGTWFKNILSTLNPGGNSQAVDLFNRLGGEIAQPLGLDFPYTKHMVRGMFRGKMVHTLQHPVDALRNFLQIPESASRATEVEQVLKDMGWGGKSPLTLEQSLSALLAGRQVTSDFVNYGRWAKAINSIVPFFGPSVAGLKAFSRTFKRAKDAGPRGWTRLAWRALLTLTIPTLIAWWRNKDKKWYRDMPHRERYTYLYTDDGQGNLYRFPRTFEWGSLFSVIPEAILDRLYEQDPKAVKEALAFTFDQLSPAGTLSDPMLPVPMKIAWEEKGNRVGFSGAKIVPESEKDLPPGEQRGPYTSKLAGMLGDILPNKISPRRVDHVIRGFFGGLGQDVLSVLGLGHSSNLREAEFSDIPVLGTLARRGGTEGGRSLSVEELYDKLVEVEQKSAMLRLKNLTESPVEREQRLAIRDAVDAVNFLLSVKMLSAQKTEDRNAINQQAIAIAKDVMGAQSYVEAWKFRKEMKFGPLMEKKRLEPTNSIYDKALRDLKR